MPLVVSESPIKGTFVDQTFSKLVALMQGTVIRWVDSLRNPQRSTSPSFSNDLRQLGIDPTSLNWGPMTFLPYRAEYLVNEIIASPPRAVLEVGAGLSTLLFAAWSRYGFSVFSVENFKGSVDYVRYLLKGVGEEQVVQRSGFVRKQYPDGRSYRWYGADLAQALQREFDFVFIDGPMKTLVGRDGALAEVAPYLAPDNKIFLDDTNLEHGRSCVQEWKRYFPLLEVREDCFGVTRLHLPLQASA